MKNQLIKHFVVAFILSATLPAAAQTGRIAHYSHGGSVATLATRVASDNFGIPPSRGEHAVDSLVCLNDSVALSYGRYRSVPWQAGEAELKKAIWQPYNNPTQYFSGRPEPQKWQEAVKELRQQYPRAKLVGFDKQLKKRGLKKPVGRTQTFSKRPFQYSFWRGLAGVAGLGAVGWLLGRKRTA